MRFLTAPTGMNPVFIVGMNGSGTTMLLDCLNNHPKLYGFPRETKILPHYIRSLSKYGNLYDDGNFLRLLDDLRCEFVYTVMNSGQAVPLPADWRDLPRCLGNAADCIYMHFATSAGKERWCEKTPMNVLHISSLSNFFPKGKFVHIIRDGRSCAASLHRRWRYRPEVSIYRWKKIVREGRKQGLGIGNRYYEVHYEELTAEPEQEMKKICRFLDLDYDRRILEVSRARVFTGSNASTIIRDKERWRYYFDSSLINKLEKIAGKELNNFGYVTKHPHSDHDLPKLSLIFWLYYGYSKMKLRKLLKDAFRDKKNFEWKKHINALVDEVKSRRTTKY